MSGTISAAPKLQEAVAAFLEAEKTSLTLCEDGDVVVRPCPEGERVECRLHVLYAGGWIACERARAVARLLGMYPPQMGRLLNRLDIKVRKCALGCF